MIAQRGCAEDKIHIDSRKTYKIIPLFASLCLQLHETKTVVGHRTCHASCQSKQEMAVILFKMNLIALIVNNHPELVVIHFLHLWF